MRARFPAVLEHTFCRICESLGGLEVELLGGRVARILVEVNPAAGPQDAASWSGIAEAAGR